MWELCSGIALIISGKEVCGNTKNSVSQLLVYTLLAGLALMVWLLRPWPYWCLETISSLCDRFTFTIFRVLGSTLFPCTFAMTTRPPLTSHLRVAVSLLSFTATISLFTHRLIVYTTKTPHRHFSQLVPSTFPLHKTTQHSHFPSTSPTTQSCFFNALPSRGGSTLSPSLPQSHLHPPLNCSDHLK